MDSLMTAAPSPPLSRRMAYSTAKGRLVLCNHAENWDLVQSHRATEQDGLNDRTPKRAAGVSGGDHGPLNAPAPTLNNKLRMPHTGAHPSAAWPSRQVSFLAPGRA